MRRYITLYLTLLFIITSITVQALQRENPRPKKMSEKQANEWYKQWGWLRGCNFQPSTAINQLEMWQKETFDVTTIDRELKWASDMGMNCMRVYLHHLVWVNDRDGFKDRIKEYLSISDKYGISTIFVFFDDCWNARYTAGKQPEPKPGVHNSGWVRDPGDLLFEDTTMVSKTLEPYVKDILTSFKDDKRIVFWDLYNEAGNSGYKDRSLPLLKQVFQWAQTINPSQPLSSGIWGGSTPEMKAFLLTNSDIITYHNYRDSISHQKEIDELKKYHRPLICTEYMNRRDKSTFDKIMPMLKANNVGAINWGFVAGKTNTIFAWDQPIADGSEPALWFHDILRKDGTPFRQEEVDLIKKLTGKAFTLPPGTVIHNSKAATHRYVGSPSITILDDGTYIASHDYFGKGRISDAFVYRSSDRGQTWVRCAHLERLCWATLFTRGKELYLFGVRPKGGEGIGDCVILKSLDGGYTWTQPTDKNNGLLLEGFYHTAPVPIVFHAGKIWRAMENRESVDGWGNFWAMMMSAKDDSDLLKSDSWNITNKMNFDGSWLEGASAWLEGNAVIAKDNSMKNILRVHYPADDKAAVMDVSKDGKKISFNPQKGFANLPGACKKFSVRYDELTKKYWTLSNYVLPEDRGGNVERIRNTIALSWSDDLINWHVKDILLHDKDINRHGFQYVDWLIEGNDIIAVSRTAWDDETGQADNQHNANYLTFHRFINFRDKK